MSAQIYQFKTVITVVIAHWMTNEVVLMVTTCIPFHPTLTQNMAPSSLEIRLTLLHSLQVMY